MGNVRRARGAALLLGLGLTFGAYACGSSGGTSDHVPGDLDSSTPPSSNDSGETIHADAQSDVADAACPAVVTQAKITASPVDIIWIVDNSASMAPAITQVQQGLNAFATTIAASGLDYRVIMLSLRSATSPVIIGGSSRYPVCIPPPLAGDAACGDGARFFQSSIDIRSGQGFEQFLGTLGQTAGYTAGESRGGPPWAEHLRATATKMIAVVTDDNLRLSADDFETFAGGKNPFNATTLPPGILDPSWNGMFDGYRFSGVYGWGDPNDPSVTCVYPDQTRPASSGPTITSLVQKTGGQRVKICDGAAAWQTFFDDVAHSVIQTAKVSCEIAIPASAMGASVDPTKVNVAFGTSGNWTNVPNVADSTACATDVGWYYDDPQQPTKLTLCPASCDAAQVSVGPGRPGEIHVLFGCQTIQK